MKKTQHKLGWFLGLLFTALLFASNALATRANQEMSLIEAIEQISQNYEVYFTFDKTLVSGIKVNYEPKRNRNVEEAVSGILKGTSLSYRFYNNRYMIIYKNDEEGLESLKKMASYIEKLADEEKAILVMEKAAPVKGKVTVGESGEGLEGVSVKIKGTDQGTVTDAQGNYMIDVAGNEGTLVFSYIGYTSQEVAVKGQSTINVVMIQIGQDLDEVVVVGYGTQKKVNLTGAVATVTGEDLETRTVTKSSLALQGQMSGISVRQASGNPGSNAASLIIRGQGTFSGAGNNPLVLVDGIESSMDAVDPNDIESVSILKDAASAAIFGSKAANGVILIATKKGIAGKPVFSYNTYVGKQSPTTIPEMVNSWEYAEVVNETYENMGQQKRYSDEEIQKFRSGTDPDYPNFDHIGYLFGSGSGMQTKHDISMRGGTEQTQYMFSASYYDQQGLIKKNRSDQYNIRLNLDGKLHDKVHFSVKLAGSKSKSKEPSSPNRAGLSGIVSGAMRNANAIPGPTEDGYWGRNETLHPEADLNSKSFVSNGGSSIYTNGSVVWDIIKGLKITGQVGYTQGMGEYKGFVATYPITPTYGITLNSLSTSWSQSSALTLQSILEYDKVINDHTFHVLGGISGQSYESKNISAYRDDFPNNEIYEIDAGATARGTQGGSASRNTLASYFGRLNYNFREKYLFEANFRYDGSSRFPEDHRWGLFPSFSAGWRISQESFLQDVSWLSDLKIRGSWGELGNQSIGNYPYQDLLALGQNYPFGNELAAGGAVTTIANKEITWETTRITDIGIDLSLLQNKLDFSADYFIKNTSDILYNVSVSNLLGATPSATNAGSVENKGWDFNLRYRNSVGDFSYGASAVFSIVHNKVTRLAKIDQDINRGLFVGYPIGSAYGYVSDGLFVSDEEVANYPTQPFSFLANAGGIKYVDISGPDGTPDGVVNSSYDRTIIGTPLPITTYAFTLHGAYKNFDFNLMMQGEGGRNDMINIGQFFFPLENNSNVQREAYENRWTYANPNPNATYPKMVLTSSGFYSTNDVDYWYRDATFLRLKNVQVGYTLPQQWLERIFLDKVRIYVSGENLFTITKYYDGWDPEMQTGGAGLFYPLTKLYVAGINVKF